MAGAAEPAGTPEQDRLAPPDVGAVARTPVAAFLRGLGHPVVLMFLLAGVFDAVAGDPFLHWGTLLAVGGALAWDTARAAGAAGAERGASAAAAVRPATARRRLRPALILGGVAYALVAGSFARYTWPATLAVVLPAGVGVGGPRGGRGGGA